MRELIQRIEAAARRINEIANLCEREQRTRTEAEEKEYLDLVREKSLCEMKLNALSTPETPRGSSMTAVVRARLKSGSREPVRYELRAEGDGTTETPALQYTGTTEVEAGGAMPVRIEDVVKPLYEGLILNQLGIDLRTGLSGEYVWPVAEAVTFKVAGESVKVASQKLDLSKVKARPERVSANLALTRQSIVQSDGLVENLATQLLPEGLAALINKVMFSVDKVEGAGSWLQGPFVAKKASATQISAYTYKAFTQMKADVLKSGVEGAHLAFVMSKATAAILEGTPRDSGSGLMILEDGKIAGVPVFTTGAIGDSYIGIGDWTYQVMGLFGDISLVVDPYTNGDADMVNFYMNANYGMATLRPDAFVLRKCPTT